MVFRMKWINTYDKLGLSNNDEVFDFLLSSLKPSNMLWTYFVNWDKVNINTRSLEVNLNILNYLIGKEDFDTEFRAILREHPSVISVLPALAVRDGNNTRKFKIISSVKDRKIIYEDFDFTNKNPSDEDIDKYLKFVTKTGIKNLFAKEGVKNLVDYMLGVEAGLDSNGRKNRGGHSMEAITEAFVKDFCERNGGTYLKEANAAKIKLTYGIDVPVDKSSRRYDFVINFDNELSLIETNFYGGGGSKLKSTAGEYRNLHDTLAGRFRFIWITDGYGWKTTKLPLRETFENNDHVLNLTLLENNVLDSIVID